jgi:hypothetical protein
MEDDDEETLPTYPFGLVFFRSIRVGRAYPVPCFDQLHKVLTWKAFLEFLLLKSDWSSFGRV